MAISTLPDAGLCGPDAKGLPGTVLKLFYYSVSSLAELSPSFVCKFYLWEVTSSLYPNELGFT